MAGKHSVNLCISDRGLNLLPNFQKKGEGLAWSQFLDGGWDISGEGVQFLHKNKLKPEIFISNRLLTNISSVNLNSEFSYF